MKAIILKKNAPIESKPLQLVHIPEPNPTLDQLKVKVKYCGVCRTDLHIIEGDIKPKKLPIVPGHQIVGIVESVGNMVTRFKIGERVGVIWLATSCGKCKFCLKDLENLCLQAEFTGYTVDGGYAEYLVIGQDYAYPLSIDLPDVNVAPLLCAGVIGFRSYKMAKVGRGDNLGLVGFGSSAYLVIQVANYFGCNVYVFTRDKEKKMKAKRLGAKWVGSIKDKPAEKLDAAILFAPVGEFVPVILKDLDRGGRLIINAIHTSPIPKINYGDLWYEKSIQSIANVTRKDADEFLDLASKIPIKPEVQVFSLEKVNEVLIRLKQGGLQESAVLKIR